MELSPTAIGVILVVILSVTTTQYWIAPPMATEKTDSLDQNEQEESQVHYYHGPANGEFDWCEPNYLSLAYIAEPINTLSGALYFLPVIAGFRFHRMKDLSLSTKLNLIFVAWIGVGTILFHATLRYTAQLLDELPIYYVMISGTYMLLVLGKADGSGTLGWFLTIWASALTMVILLTDQDDWVHNVARGTLSVSFSLMFAHLFAGVATALRKLKKRVEANPRTQAEDSSAAAAIQSGQKLFQQTFFYFVLAILCWIVDNGFCDHLHPEGMLGLPFYIQTHAIWHVFTSIGLYQMALVLEFVSVAAANAATTPEDQDFVPGVYIEHKGALSVAVLKYENKKVE